ncbi:hypothetical protein ACJ41P_10485 [Azospirillum argentinense]|uniref:Uncharacterized protein n=1 Tax=Azospirillum argentinense TaxID=2970906 RepID=A0ABW8V590_9PROT
MFLLRSAIAKCSQANGVSVEEKRGATNGNALDDRRYVVRCSPDKAGGEALETLRRPDQHERERFDMADSNLPHDGAVTQEVRHG